MLSNLVSGGSRTSSDDVNFRLQSMHRRGSEPTYVDLTTYLGPNPQVYRKVPIINPVHRSRASQHPWLPERSTKLAVGASGGVLPPHSHYKQGQYSRFLRPVVAYGDGYSSPPIPGDSVYLHFFFFSGC